MSHGCSTSVIPLFDRRQKQECVYMDVILQTSPAFHLQANYCFCIGDGCNIVKPFASRTPSKFKLTEIKLSKIKEGLPYLPSQSEYYHPHCTLYVLSILCVLISLK